MEFPIVDAYLITPDDAASGHVGICTNTSAPGQVYNELEQENRPVVSVLGTLIANRDGTERMLLNTLIHPHIKFLVLFSEETITFSPSTNLLLALMNGLDTTGANNILGGQAASAHYPNLTQEILDTFSEQVVVLPLFMFKNDFSTEVIDQYLDWLTGKIDAEVVDYLREANSKKKIYYDVLNGLVALLRKHAGDPKVVPELDPKQFQHLQPPKVEIGATDTKIEAPFRTSVSGGRIRLDLQLSDGAYWIEGIDEFLLEYSVMKFLDARKSELSALEQLCLGVELSRINVEIQDSIAQDSYIQDNSITGETEIPLLSQTDLLPDKEYYYKFALKDERIVVSCLAFDVCEAVYELHGSDLAGLVDWLAENNRFADYEMDILHRMDIGSQVARAAIANEQGYSFIQDFYHLFKVNTEKLPFFVVDCDNFLDGHKNVLKSLYTGGISEEHADSHKGLARTGSVLAVYRDVTTALSTVPQLYKQGELSINEMRDKYKQQLLRFDHDGNYSYGERTRTFFGHDQLPVAAEHLQKNTGAGYMVQRFDPVTDMGMYTHPDTGNPAYTHDPCLTHDIFWVRDGVLHAFHIARAHNTVNAYPENIFGLHDAYIQTVATDMGLPAGDMYMLSSRANILMLTEEQRTKNILAEPSKGVQEKPVTSGPASLEADKTSKGSSVAYRIHALEEKTQSDHVFIAKLRDYRGEDTVVRAAQYLRNKGNSHNNPILSTFDVRADDPCGEHMLFFQANVFAGKLFTTTVFVNRSPDNLGTDQELVNHLATQYVAELSVEYGESTIIYVAYE